MRKIKNSFQQIAITSHLLKRMVLVIPLSVAVGSMVALFLWLLDKVTALRWQTGWLLYLLPAAGMLVYFLYKIGGKNTEAGNNLIMEEIHQPGGGIPARMTPLVLITTLITHLFGGSAGREGTAVQMGGSMASVMARAFTLEQKDARILLMTGIAAGFGAVFGTPVTGAIFALEVLVAGTIRYEALLPCLAASVLADISCTAWGIHHTQYHIQAVESVALLTSFIHIDFMLLAKIILAGAAFGLASYVFAEMQHAIKKYSNRFIHYKWMIPAIGGLLIIVLCYAAGTRDYIGLGVTANEPNGISIVSSFNPGGANTWSWLWKMVFTAITLGMGFKGGELTPLFFIGAALGNTIASISGSPVDLFAGLGLIAVFAGATNTPVACTIMGVELFGGEHILYYAIACFTAYYCSGHSGIYAAQRKAVDKR